MEPLRGQLKKNAIADWMFHKRVALCQTSASAEEWTDVPALAAETTRHMVRIAYPRLASLDIEVKAVVDENMAEIGGLDFSFLMLPPRDQPYQPGYQARNLYLGVTAHVHSAMLPTGSAVSFPHLRSYE